MAKPAPNSGLEYGMERLERVGSKRRQKHRRGGVERPDAPAERFLFGMSQTIYFVEHENLGSVPEVELIENVLDHGFLPLPTRIRGVDDVGQHVSLSSFLECRAERGDEMVRQFPNESDGVCDEGVETLAQVHRTGRRIERGEESVLDQEIRAGQSTEE